MKQLLILLYCLLATATFACTAVSLHQGPLVNSGRSMDWPDGRAYMVVSPRGQARHARSLAPGRRPLHWRSKWGSVLITMANAHQPNLATILDGLNEQGLSAALLHLNDAQYPTYSDQSKVLGSTQWVEYVVDHFSSVKQTIQGMKHLPVVTSLYHGNTAPVHFIVTDSSGHSAIFEYTHHQLHIYQNKDKPSSVLTNTDFPVIMHTYQDASLHPKTKQHLISGHGTLARFIRAKDAVSQLPKLTKETQAYSALFGILANSAQPLGSPFPTQWTLVRDNKHPTYYWRKALDQRIKSLSLASLNLHAGAGMHWFKL